MNYMVESLCREIEEANPNWRTTQPHTCLQLMYDVVRQGKPEGSGRGEPYLTKAGINDAQFLYWNFGHDLYTALMMSGGLKTTDTVWI